MTMFAAVSSKVDFPALEREVLQWWEERGILRQYLRRNEDAPRRWSFLDGPITANNPMGVHHAWGRTYKDLFQRYKTMRGYRQRYQNGFDCQGLWVEVEVEKDLGFASKRDIESFGIEPFVNLCKHRVLTFAAVQTEAPGALFRAAARAGARQLVQISALGADAGVRTPFLLTKRAADELALGLGVPAVVLRPSVVYGPGDHSMAFFRRLAALPVTPVPGDGRYRLQPVHVDDLVRAVVLACARPGRHGAFDLGGGTVLTFNALLHALARHRGRRRARLLHVPWPLMRLVARLTDLAGRGPITTDELTMLRRGSVADNGPFVATFGFAPRPFRPG